MWILERLGLMPSGPAPDGQTEAVRAIARRLAALPRDRARYLAAFACVLGRVAHADQETTAAEARSMQGILERTGGLPPDQAGLAVEIARRRHRRAAGAEAHPETAELRELANQHEREQVLDCLFEVAAADARVDERGSISPAEEALIRQVAGELGVLPPEYQAIAGRWSRSRAGGETS